MARCRARSRRTRRLRAAERPGRRITLLRGSLRSHLRMTSLESQSRHPEVRAAASPEGLLVGVVCKPHKRDRGAHRFAAELVVRHAAGFAIAEVKTVRRQEGDAENAERYR